MSALFGMWQKNNAPVAPAFDAMENALSEWQCDTRATWCDTQIGMGARLLYTTPESLHERIPFTHPEYPQFILVADAWLDNRAELCDVFQIPHMERAHVCDSELILRAYEKWGNACADKLRGDFAFALWDAHQERWYCARDFTGSKPFFYFASTALFCFASDVRAVLACPDVPNQLDEVMLAAYLVQSTITAEKRRTFYQNVFRIPPAHFLVVTRAQAALTRYWSPENIPPIHFANPAAYAEHTREMLERAVQRATRTEYRVGAHLSGGLDSTTVAILAARALQTRDTSLNGYSWSPPPSQTQIENDADERAFIETVCAQEHITPRYLEYSVDDVVRLYTRDFTRIPREMALREEQLQDLAAQDQVRVLLSGWGGDELISYGGEGYLGDLLRRGAFLALHRALVQRLPRGARYPARVRAYGNLLYRHALWMLLPDWAWEKFSPYAVPRFETRYIHPEFLERQRAAVYARRDPVPRVHPSVRGTQIVRLEHGHLTRRMESWATHGAKRGVVYRYPLLERELVEGVLGLPPMLYHQHGRARAVLRAATRGVLPEAMRVARSKDEPTALGIVGAKILEGTRALYEQTRAQFAQHPATHYVNVDAIQQTMTHGTLEWKEARPVQVALSFFYIAQLNS